MSDDRQQRIGFEHRERDELALIRSLSSIRSDTLTKGRLKAVQRLIETLYKWSSGFVSHAKEATIAAREAVDERTVKNWIRDAKALGVLTVEKRGRVSSIKTIHMDKIRELVRPGTTSQRVSENQPTPVFQRETVSVQGETISAQRETVSVQGEMVSPLLLGSFVTPLPPPPTRPRSEWAAAEAEVMREVTDWQTPINAARAAKVPPKYVLDVIAYYRETRGLYGSGALYRRLCRSHPELPPREGWPKPTEPSAGCKRAMDVLAQARSHPIVISGTIDEARFSELLRRQLEKQNLAEYLQEALFRESLQRC